MRLPAALVAVVCLASCAGRRARTPDIDDLGFLAGCWTYFHIDWGFTLCWRRSGEAWRGDLAYVDVRSRASARLAIEPRDGTLELRAQPAEAFWDVDRVRLTSLAGSAIGFGAGEQHVALRHDPSNDTLVLSFGPRMRFPCEYPCTPRVIPQFRLRRVR